MIPHAPGDDTIRGRLGDVFVELADTLSSDFHWLDLMYNLTEFAVDLLPVAAASVMLANDDGHLVVVASSHETARQLEFYEAQAQDGPCLDCFRTSQPIVNVGAAAMVRWPEFTAKARAAGFAFVHALPMQLRDQTIGAMSLFADTATDLTEQEIRLGRALAAIATIGILQERVGAQKDLRSSQLQQALNSRIVIEQAKGTLAERNGVSTDDAFKAIRRYARGRNTSITAAARELMAGEWHGEPKK